MRGMSYGFALYTIRWDLVCKISGYERYEVIYVCVAYDLSYLVDRFGFDSLRREWDLVLSYLTFVLPSIQHRSYNPY